MGGALHLGTLESKEHTLQVVHDESYHDHDESYHLFMITMITMKVYILFPQSLGEALEAVEFSPDGTLLAVAFLSSKSSPLSSTSSSSSSSPSSSSSSS